MKGGADAECGGYGGGEGIGPTRRLATTLSKGVMVVMKGRVKRCLESNGVRRSGKMLQESCPEG